MCIVAHLTSVPVLDLKTVCRGMTVVTCADMIDDQQGCTLIAEQFARGANTAQAASALVSAAYHKGSCDNISVLVMRIRRRQPGDVNVGAG